MSEPTPLPHALCRPLKPAGAIILTVTAVAVKPVITVTTALLSWLSIGRQKNDNDGHGSHIDHSDHAWHGCLAAATVQ